jgi:hypothetical protein
MDDTSIVTAGDDLQSAEDSRGSIVSVAFHLCSQQEDILFVQGVAGQGIGGQEAAHPGDGAGPQAAGHRDRPFIASVDSPRGVGAQVVEEMEGGLHGQQGYGFLGRGHGPVVGLQVDGAPEIQGQAQTIEARA